MSNTLTIFENNANVPAFMREDNTNNDLLKHASEGFVSMSIKGKIFTLVKGGDRKIVPNPRDPESPATFIDVIMLKVSPNTSKSYYETGFNENAEDQRPTCFSNDGITPDASVEHPQCKTCAACKWNAWGSARGTGDGSRKGKACSDYIRTAIADPTNLEEPIMLRIPPASIRAVGDYGKLLARHKAPYQGVVTRIAFDPKEATPRLMFKPMSFVSEAEYRKIKEVAESERVKTMVFGDAPMDDEPVAEHPIEQKEVQPVTPPSTVKEAEADKIIDKVIESAPQEEKAQVVSTPAPETKKAEVKVAETTDDLGAMLSDLGFE